MSATVLQGDCLETLKTIDAGSVQCVVTSPPYYGLRDYGTAKWEGGDPGCDHQDKRTWKGGRGAKSEKQVTNQGTQVYYFQGKCEICGAVRIDNQIGLEESPEAYVQKLVAVFCEVRHVLSDDGTLWLNLGDSYATGGTRQGDSGEMASRAVSKHRAMGYRPTAEGCKPKDMIGIPWMVAFALRADGWYLRSDIIWHKPNPMPESVTDRPTKSHEHIFLFSKSATYFYDAEAIKEPASYNTHARVSRARLDHKSAQSEKVNGIRPRKVAESGSGIKSNTSFEAALVNLVDSRNKRDVWTVNSHPYREAHFATFPPKLIEPCILAGSRVGDIVLDPFNGSGTTGAVAIKHHRSYIGCELNPDYIRLTNKRLGMVQPVLFPQVQS